MEVRTTYTRIPDDVWEDYCRLPDGIFTREDVCIEQRDFIDMIINGIVIRESITTEGNSNRVGYMKV